MKTVIKLTDQNLRTHNRCQWIVGEWKKTDGTGYLCGPGWLHAYENEYVAVFMNPAHANFCDPFFWCAEVRGRTIDDNGLKCGWVEMRLIKRVTPVEITTTQRTEIAIRCAMTVYKAPSWIIWAKKWIAGADRSHKSAEAEAAEAAEAGVARAAEAAARAARAAAEAAAAAASEAAAEGMVAAWAAEAAARAAAAEAAEAAARAAGWAEGWAVGMVAAWAEAAEVAAWAEAAEAVARAEAAEAAEAATRAAAVKAANFDLTEIIKLVLKGKK